MIRTGCSLTRYAVAFALLILAGCAESHHEIPLHRELSSNNIERSSSSTSIESNPSFEDAAEPVKTSSSPEENSNPPNITPSYFEEPMWVDEWEEDAKVWKEEQAMKYQAPNYEAWQSEIYQLLERSTATLNEEDYAGYSKILEGFKWEGKEVAWCTLGFNFYLKNPDQALPAIQELLKSYNFKLGMVKITWMPCDYNLKQIKAAEKDLQNQKLNQSKIGQQIVSTQIRDGKLFVDGLIGCDDLKRYLHEHGYTSFSELGIIDPDNGIGILV